MRNSLAKIWVPIVLVGAAAVQSFGIDVGRMAGIAGMADSLNLIGQNDSSQAVTLSGDTVFNDQTDTLFVAAKDTIKVPDSLRTTDPFKFKYYIAIKDSLTRAQVRDSLISAGDTLELHKLDSLYIKDSAEVATAKFEAWFNSLSKREKKKYIYEQELPAKIAEMNRKLAVKDSLKAVRDSITESTPRILETYVLPDSLQYKRMLIWENDRNFQDLKLKDVDTSYNYNFHEYPFFKKDVNASYLGVIGSPVQNFNYFKRDVEDNAIFYAPYKCYNASPETITNYNTKTPYTELAYWGTLFADRKSVV